MTKQDRKLGLRKRWASVWSLPFLFSSTPLLAEGVSRQQFGSTGSLMLQVTLGLVVVIGLMFILAWLAKRMRWVPGSSHHHALKVLAILPLSNRERLALVQVGEQQLLLGVTAGQISCLHELEKPIAAPSGDRQVGFSQLLNQWKAKTQAGQAANKDFNNEG